MVITSSNQHDAGDEEYHTFVYQLDRHLIIVDHHFSESKNLYHIDIFQKISHSNYVCDI